MTQSMIGFVVGLAILLVIAFVFARRYMHAHPEETVTQWLDAHHMSWIHHKH
ncbi:hypothetical protein B0G80_4745 [Paraburkholderia sp. BL6669N2]|uniref:hypothetical protein n=1 Tax=unclassified Paraburkholderia TaxID=2615204 RepID=UPI000E3A9EC5|nr:MULTISPECIES: hypothetical protein [unclassified Paraburkholderia]REG48515.1 hypothetical protein B0G80_4745 [Paraburkholderia sp. BL6669N2]TDY21511.1 hypothetical protein B0G81_1730 [Paraburkholderia sp. BL6665CI2N2]